MLVLVRLELEDSRQLSLDMASHPMLPHFPLSLSSVQAIEAYLSRETRRWPVAVCICRYCRVN